MIDWPEYLIEAIARRKSVLFLGSGISSNSCNDAGKHPLTWEAFLRDILAKRPAKLAGQKDVIEQMLSINDYLTACEIIVETLGDHDFGELAANEFRRPGYKPSDIHEAVYRLDSRLVLTPNIDKIYEQYAMNASHSTYSKEIELSLLHNRNLELLTYDNPDGTHQQLLDELKGLINRVEEKREEISAKSIW